MEGTSVSFGGTADALRAALLKNGVAVVGKSAAAEVLIEAEAYAEEVGIAAGLEGLSSYRARISARALRVGSLDVIASGTWEEAALNLSKPLAAAAALEKAAAAAGDGIAAKLLGPPSAPAPGTGAREPSQLPPAPGIDIPGYKFREKPDWFALVVGIEAYHKLPAANFAERDAWAVRAHLLAQGYPERNVVLLLGPDAVRSGIEKYVEAWLPKNAGKGSRVFFYFAGHGAPGVQERELRDRETYLVPWDGDLKYLQNTAYPIKRLYERLDSLKAGEAIVVLDACFSGLGGRSPPLPGRPLVQIQTTPPMGKVVVFSAAAATEIAGAAPSQGHGLFTYYFLKGLGGEAKSRAGKVTVKSLHDYLFSRVPGAASLENGTQTPQLLPDPPGDRGSMVLLDRR